MNKIKKDMENITKHLIIISSRLGLTENGNLNGNGLITEIKNINTDIKDISNKLSEIKDIQSSNQNEIHIIHKDMVLQKEQYTSLEDELGKVKINIVSIEKNIEKIKGDFHNKVISKNYIIKVAKNISVIGGAIGALSLIAYTLLKMFS